MRRLSMPFYELVYVLRGDLTPADVDNETRNLEKILQEQKGKVVTREYWGLRILAYKIKKNTRGHYVLLGIEASNEALKEIERVMGFNENIIRVGIFRVDTLAPEGSELKVTEWATDPKVIKGSEVNCG
jgi:small subunit ribosomal protein S6